MIYTLSYYFLIFLLCAFIGYLTEVTYCSILEKKFVNRGFLMGPICPIYGIGGILIIWLLLRYEEDPIVVFVFGVLITSGIEYFTSYLLEKLFHNKWWDYSEFWDSLNGRIRLTNSVMFGIMALVVVYLAYPVFSNILNIFSPFWIKFLGIVFFVLFLFDLTYSIMIAYNLRNRIIIAEELKNAKLRMLPGYLEHQIREKVAKFRAFPNRLLKAFPSLKAANFEEFEAMRKVRQEQRQLKLQNKKKKKANKKR